MKTRANHWLFVVALFFIINTAFSNDENSSSANIISPTHTPGTSAGFENLRINPDSTGFSIMNGNGSINNSYTATACGLNYTAGSVVLIQRNTSGPPRGSIQPANISISGIPTCAIIERAFLYADASGNGVAITATVRNPGGTSNNFPMIIIGTHSDKCWGSVGYAASYSYRADVTSIITTNGNYTISGFPVGATNDVDGATLVVVYRDPTQLWTGTLVIGDGAHVATGSGQIGDNIVGWTACAASTSANAFMIIADLQGVGNTAISMNGTAMTQLAANDRWWNFIQVASTTVTAGQNLARFTANNGGDCYNIVADGLYFRTNCLTCVPPTLTVSMSTSLPCQPTFATATPSGGSAPYTYSWSNGANTQTISGVPPGSYSVTVTDATGCLTRTSSVTIPPSTPPAITVNSPSICGSGSVVLTASGASTYTWTGGLPNGASVTTPVLTTTTSYTVTGTDANGCTNTAVATVTVNPVPTVSVNSPTICAGNSVGLNATGATTYTWTGGLPNGANVTTPVLNSTTSYTVTGTTAGCSNTATATVTVNPLPSVTVNSPAICEGFSANLNANGANTYSWTGGLPPNASVNTPVLTSTTSYTVTGTGVNGCTNTATATVTVNPTPTVTVNSPSICAGNSAALSAGGASTYTWTGGLPNGANVTTPVLNSNTTYTVTGTDVNGCVNTAISNVTVNPNPVVSVNSPTICAGNTVGLNASGANTYTWTGGLPNGANVTTPVLNTTTSYTVTGTTAAGCSGTATATVTVNPNPVVTVNSPAICTGSSASLTANGASTYTWTGGLPSNSTVTTPVLTNTTSYTVTGTGANGCTNTATSTVTVNPLPTVSVNSPTICAGNTASITATGASTYTWTGGLPNGASVTTPILNTSTSYTVTGTDVNGCVNNAISNVTVNPNPVVNVNSPTICAGFTANLNASGAATYSWTGGLPASANVTTPILNSTTSYTVTGTSGAGCTGTAVATVTVNSNPVITVNSPSICEGFSASLTATGANSYSWTGGLPGNATVTTPVLTSTTSYTVTGTNGVGCTSTATATVTVNPTPVVSVTSPTICAGNTANITASGASTYTWTGGLPNGANVTTPVLNSTTNYTVTGTDVNGCLNTATSTVTVNPNPVVSVNSPTICAGETATLNANGANTYTWTGGLPNGASVTTPVLSSTTSYTVTGSSAAGCTGTATSTVTVTPAPNVSVNSTAICIGQNTVLTASGADTYTWSTGASGASITVSPGTTTSYSVTGLFNGCTVPSTATATVTVNPLPIVTVNSPVICSGNAATLSAGGASTYTWTGGLPNGSSVITPTLTSSTSYTVTGTDGNGCVNTAVSFVTVNPLPNVTVTSPTICSGETAVINANGANTYSWTGGLPNGSSVSTPVLTSTTTYTVTGTDGNGCSKSATSTVTVNPLPVVTVNSPGICTGFTAALSAGGANTYTWTGGLPNGPNVNTPVLTSTTSYTVTGTDENGCSNTALSTVTVYALPTVTVNSPVICQGESATLTANGASTYTWTGGLAPGNSTSTPVLNSNANYTVTGTDMNSCKNTAVAFVTVNPVKATSVSQTICDGQSVTIGSQTFPTTGVYTVNLQTSLGCDSVVTLNLTVKPNLLVEALLTSTQNEICNGTRVTFNATPVNGGTTPVYQWYLNNNPFGTNVNQCSLDSLNDGDQVFVQITSSEMCTQINPAFSAPVVMKVHRLDYTIPAIEFCEGGSQLLDLSIPQTNYTIHWTNEGHTQVASNNDEIELHNTTSGNVQFTVHFGNNCQRSDVVPVTVNPLPDVFAEVDRDLVKYLEEVQLNTTGTGGLGYSWISTQQMSNDTISNPTAVITSPAWFTVTGTDINGCRVSDSVFVNMTDECFDDFVFVPTGFTPNNDGLNDCFGILYAPPHTEFKLVVFDRWGERLFETGDISNCWDGKYKGVDALMDGYSFVVGFRCYNGTVIMKKGIVTLVR